MTIVRGEWQSKNDCTTTQFKLREEIGLAILFGWLKKTQGYGRLLLLDPFAYGSIVIGPPMFLMVIKKINHAHQTSLNAIFFFNTSITLKKKKKIGKLNRLEKLIEIR